jgi:hypothetical protein
MEDGDGTYGHYEIHDQNIFIPSIFILNRVKKKSQIEDHGMKLSIVIVQQLVAH